MFRLSVIAGLAAGLVLVGDAAWARGGYLTTYLERYASASTPDDGCLVCHGPSGRGSFNRYGLDFLGQSGATDVRLAAIESLDSDGEGHTNKVEIDAGAQPGWCVSSTAGCNNNGFTPPSGAEPLDPPSNQPPVADAGGPYSATVNVPVTLDGSGSVDPDGSIASYAWDFGDGTSGSGVSPSTTYANPGTYTVVLTVTDDLGAAAQATTPVTVTTGGQPPLAQPGGPYEGSINVPIAFDGTGSSDADGSIVGYAWDFGDGATSTDPSPVYAYTATGIYQVALTVTDDDGLTDTATTQATVNDGSGMQAPVAEPGGPYAGTTASPVEFDGSSSWDLDGNIVSFDWDYGDGASGAGVSTSHTYAAAGVYTVALTVTDDSGLSDIATTTADIIDAVNRPPVADPGGPYTGEVGVPVQFDGRASTDADGNVMSYAWDFGDGSSGSGAAPTHAYAAAGDYTVTLRVTDDSGTRSEAATTAVFIATVDPGKALYDVHCLDCHGDPWGGPAVDASLAGLKRVAGARGCTIEGAIRGTSVFPGGVPAMVDFGNGSLSNQEIDSIAGYLNSRGESGEQRYVSACAGCHGNDGRGGRVNEGVRGEGAGSIREAIREEGTMRFLDCLPASDVDSIAGYLKTGTGGSQAGSESGGGGSTDAVALAGLLLIGLCGVKRKRHPRSGKDAGPA